VVELGAGIGLVAMTLASMGADVVATERKIALPILERNVAENRPFETGSLKILELDWTKETSWRFLPKTEYFVGSDLVFPSNKDAQEGLLQVILGLVNERKISGWISHEPRNDQADYQFWGKLQEHKVAVRKMNSDELPKDFPPDLIIYEIGKGSN